MLKFLNFGLGTFLGIVIAQSYNVPSLSSMKVLGEYLYKNSNKLYVEATGETLDKKKDN